MGICLERPFPLVCVESSNRPLLVENKTVYKLHRVELTKMVTSVSFGVKKCIRIAHQSIALLFPVAVSVLYISSEGHSLFIIFTNLMLAKLNN